MEITLTHILLFLLTLSFFYLARILAKQGKQKLPVFFKSKLENIPTKSEDGDNEFIIMRVPDASKVSLTDDVIMTYDTELDDITKKLDTYPSELTMDEKRALQLRYNEVIGLMVNHFRQKIDNEQFNEALSASREEGGQHAD